MSHRERPAPRGGPASGATGVAPGADPSAANGLRAPGGWPAALIGPTDIPAPHLFARLLAGDGTDELPPIDANGADGPPHLSAAQRGAVILALRTPDVALLHGRSPDGIEQVAAAIISRVVGGGERVLLLAPNPTVLDRFLGTLAPLPEVSPLRCLASDEIEPDLSPAAANCTFAGRLRRATEPARAAATEKARRETDDAIFAKLLDLAEQHERLLVRQREWEPPSPPPPSPGFAARLAGLIARIFGGPKPHSNRPANAADDRDAQAVALDRELALVAEKWDQTLALLSADRPRPAAITPGAITATWDAFNRADGAVAPAAAEDPSALAERLLSSINVVAATPAALAADPHFGAGRRGPLGLLVALAAHEVTDADLVAAARLARRWVLIGEPAAPNPGAGFVRLWQHLHCDPWAREDERVVYHLRPVPPGRRARLDREPVADRPDVELRIDTPPDRLPELAEMAFPAGAPIARAVEYVFQELGELPAGLNAECRVLTAESANGVGAERADLGGGVRPLIADTPAGWEVTAVEFDPAAGWDHARAQAWMVTHVNRQRPGRTARIDPN